MQRSIRDAGLLPDTPRLTAISWALSPAAQSPKMDSRSFAVKAHGFFLPSGRSILGSSPLLMARRRVARTCEEISETFSPARASSTTRAVNQPGARFCASAWSSVSTAPFGRPQARRRPSYAARLQVEHRRSPSAV